MADSVSMTDMIAQVRLLGGFETIDQANSFAPDADIEGRLNRNLKKVYLALLRARGARYCVKDPAYQFTTDGNSSYALPADFLALHSVSRKVANEWEPLLDYNDMERHRYDAWPVSGIGVPVRYRLSGTKLAFIPTPSAGEVIKLEYAPKFTSISGAGTFDGVSGFEEWAIWSVVAELLDKSKENPAAAREEAKWWEAEVASMARKRDGLMPPRVQRVRRQRRYGDRWA